MRANISDVALPRAPARPQPLDEPTMNQNRNTNPLHELLDRFDAWIVGLFDSVASIVSGQSQRSVGSRPANGSSPESQARRPEPAAAESPSPFHGKRSLSGYMASGMRKVDLARRSNAMQKRHASIHSTIKETRRSIKRAPRDQRGMFDGYLRFLDDLVKRERALFSHLCQAEAHLQRYDPHTLGEEIRSLERYCGDSASDSSARTMAASTLAARRKLLGTIEEFEVRYSAIAAQLSHIAATLDLNLVRIAGVINRAKAPIAGAAADDAYFNDRMNEMSEQLELLEESIRELDNW